MHETRQDRDFVISCIDLEIINLVSRLRRYENNLERAFRDLYVKSAPAWNFNFFEKIEYLYQKNKFAHSSWLLARLGGSGRLRDGSK